MKLRQRALALGLVGLAISGLGSSILCQGCGAAEPLPRTVRGAYSHPMVSLDPHAHNDSMTGAVLTAIYEPLVSFSPGEGIRPCLAESWTTPDDTTWRFRLRPGLRFHDGRPVEIEDVLASIERVRSDSQSAVSTNLQSVAAVRALPGLNAELEITTRAPFPLLLARLANVAIAPKDLDPAAPVGTGPYRWAEGSSLTSILLKRWRGYWGAAADLDEIEIKFASNEELLANPSLLKSLDFIPRINRDLLASQHLDRSWSVIQTRSISTTILGINVSRAPYSDPRVRLAIDLAIDRQHLIDAAYPDGAASIAVSLVPPEVFGFLMTDSVEGADTEQARQLLDHAGVRSGLICRLQHTGERPAVVAYLAKALGRIGLEIQPVALPYEEFYRSIETGQPELYLFGWNFRFADASNLLDSLVHTRGSDQLLGRLNATGYSDPEVDQWIERALHEPRSAERLKLLRSALARLAQDRPYIPLYHPGLYALIRNDLEVVRNPGPWLRPQDLSRAGSGPD